MPTPIKPLPDTIVRWIGRARWLRWLDALAAWLLLWGAIPIAAPRAGAEPAAVLAGIAVAVGAFVPPLRHAWRPVSAWVALRVSRPLRPGDRAWYVRADTAEPVLVTARRGFRVVIASTTLGAAESVSVRRTRVLVVPADGT